MAYGHGIFGFPRRFFYDTFPRTQKKEGGVGEMSTLLIFPYQYNLDVGHALNR